MMSKKQTHGCASSNVGALPSSLTKWAQSVTQFHALHNALQATIADRKQLILRHPEISRISQYPLSELEKARLEMVQELNELVKQMNEPLPTEQDVANQLSAHSVRLQQKSSQIQAIIWASSLIAC